VVSAKDADRRYLDDLVIFERDGGRVGASLGARRGFDYKEYSTMFSV
jgi:hypothetical protein